MNVFRNLFVASLLSVSIAASAMPGQPTIQIVGGTEASINEFPFIVSLQSGGSHFCGGSLIRKNWVLTAAHCVSGGGSVQKIIVGLHDRGDLKNAEVLTVKKVFANVKFSNSTLEWDYALIQTNEESTRTPIEMNNSEIALDGEQIMATVAGWGALKETSYSLPMKLQRVDVPLVSIDTCNVGYRGRVKDSTMICAGYEQGGRDSCQGDSGGPLVVVDPATKQQVLVGVVSWGQGCARAKYYGVYSKVSAAQQWIDETIKNNTPVPPTH